MYAYFISGVFVLDMRCGRGGHGVAHGRLQQEKKKVIQCFYVFSEITKCNINRNIIVDNVLVHMVTFSRR